MNKKSSPEVWFLGLPGGELVRQGLEDLACAAFSEQALLVLMAAPRLRGLGIDIPESSVPGVLEHRLYALLEQRRGPNAFSYYNSLIRRLVSFCHALERETSLQRRRRAEPQS